MMPSLSGSNGTPLRQIPTPFIFVYLCIPFTFASNLVSLFLFQLYYQVAQMTHILESWLKGVVEEADKERTLKEVSKSTFWEKDADLAASERSFVEIERARAAIKKRVADLVGKLGDVEEKLA